jgi:hypothetical protein
MVLLYWYTMMHGQLNIKALCSFVNSLLIPTAYRTCHLSLQVTTAISNKSDAVQFVNRDLSSLKQMHQVATRRCYDCANYKAPRPRS